MKKIIFSILIIFLCNFPLIANSSITKQINFEWEYDISTNKLAGYILYHNGNILHTINDARTLSIDLAVELIPGETSIFTMRAFDTDKNESALSVPYNLVVPINVENNNFLPIATISFVLNNDNNTIQLSAEASNDFDGNIIVYNWKFGDGITSIEKTTIHTFANAGTYNITLTVIDNSNGSNTTNILIKVGNDKFTPTGIKIKLL